MSTARLCALVSVLGVLGAGSAAAQSTTLVSVNSSGTQVLGCSSHWSSISADGRIVAFACSAGLVPADTDSAYDIYVRDRQSTQTVCVSVDSAGGHGPGDSYHARISADGRFVAFMSYTSMLVPGDTNNAPDVFVHDLLTGQTTRVSVDSAGLEANGGSDWCALSADGRHVAFMSNATNLVAGDTNGVADVFVHDLLTGQTTCVSVDSTGAPGDAASGNWYGNFSVSPDGRSVAFGSAATNLVAGDTNGASDVFVRDLLTGQTTRVSVDAAGAQGNGPSNSPSFSGDGFLLGFDSSATNLVAGDSNGQADVFLRDLRTGQTTLVSVDSSGAQGDQGSARASLSADGRYVAFHSAATNLVPGDTNGSMDAFVRDLLTGQTTRVSVDSAGVQGNGDSYDPSISADGRYVSFAGYASNLVPGDTNPCTDTFLRDRIGPGIAFCFGDGSATPCPCGNASPVGSGSGCLNSLGTGGALTASGATSLGADTLALSGWAMPNSSALYFQGTAQENGGNGSAFGDGLRCASGAIIRLSTKFNTSGASQYPSTGDPAVSVRGLVTGPGTRTYQVWYRNAAQYCTADTFNLTNGLILTWSP
jgi:Tol biopolymer transport system component